MDYRNKSKTRWQLLWDKANQKWSSLSPDNQKYLAIAAVVTILSVLGSVFSPSRAPSSAQPQQTTAPRQRVLIMNAQEGYSLWNQDDGCLIVKGITEGHLRSMGTDWDGFKASLKSRYGFQCVLSE
jgi:hypothetical protein